MLHFILLSFKFHTSFAIPKHSIPEAFFLSVTRLVPNSCQYHFHPHPTFFRFSLPVFPLSSSIPSLPQFFLRLSFDHPSFTLRSSFDRPSLFLRFNSVPIDRTNSGHTAKDLRRHKISIANTWLNKL